MSIGQVNETGVIPAFILGFEVHCPSWVTLDSPKYKTLSSSVSGDGKFSGPTKKGFVYLDFQQTHRCPPTQDTVFQRLEVLNPGNMSGAIAC